MIQFIREYLLAVQFFTRIPIIGRLADQISSAGLLIAFVWCFGALALASIALDAINLIVACSFSVLALLGLLRFFKRRLQGFTGDCLGATQQVCEIAFYLGLAVSL